MPDPKPLSGSLILEAEKGQTPATRADGPSACPGDSSHERESVGGSDASWDMQQTAKSIRVRNAGVALRPRLVFAVCFGTRGHVFHRTWRRGRGETPCRSARPFGGKEHGRPANPEPEMNEGR